MAELVYILCALFCASCALQLFLAYRRSRSQLLFWSGWCFFILTIGNSILVLDLIIIPTYEFHGQIWRNLCSATGSFLLLTGLIREMT
jgi:hypothetical protein